jgi:hypothetical protein
VEYIRETLPDGEELVLLDETEAAAFSYGPDPRRTSLRLRRDALTAQPPAPAPSTLPPSKPAGH